LARERVPDIELTHRWSGQIIETPDGLPYIGQMTEHQYAATGFCGNGLTFGTAAAILITDAIEGRANPWVELFEPGRSATWEGRGPAHSYARTAYKLSDRDGGTHFEYENEFKAPGGFLGKAASRVVVGVVPQREATESLKQLKKLLEA
jgi:glycine/D-amino acid oxidase-like deaminating enzyme